MVAKKKRTAKAPRRLHVKRVLGSGGVLTPEKKKTSVKTAVPKPPKETARLQVKRSESSHKQEKSAKKRKPSPEKLTLVESTENSAFWINGGPVLRNLRDLSLALHAISDEQYGFHVKKESNDFAKWVDEVLHDKECAHALLLVKTKDEAAECVSSRLRVYILETIERV